MAAFEKLKLFLTSSPVLCTCSPLLETELHCDASQLGFGSETKIWQQTYSGILF